MSEELRADDARQQAELAQLRAELAAAEARVAQAKAAAERAADQTRMARKSPPENSPSPKPAPKRRLAAVAAAAMSSTTRLKQALLAVSVTAKSDDDGSIQRRHFLTGLFRTSAAFGGSMVVHMLLLILLGLCMFPQVIKEQLPSLMAAIPSPQENFEQRMPIIPTPATRDSDQRESIVNPGAIGVGDFDKLVSTTDVRENLNRQIEVATGDLPRATVDWGRTRNDVITGDISLENRGDASANVDTPDEALDRLTQEIRGKLAKGKVLVIWCFDESESMKDDRAEIGQRVHVVYDELKLVKDNRGDALKTAVVSYGKDVTTRTSVPTSDLEKITAAIDAIPNDPSGKEFQCQAIGQSIVSFSGFAERERRQMMLILVTDESGNTTDNNSYTELTIATAREARCPIYVIGREAVFGYPLAHMHWTVTVPAKGGGTVSRHFLLQLDRGPESPLVESLQTDGFTKRNDAHASGFGPYEQVRMAHETGGIFFMLPTPESRLFHRDNRKYALDQMRMYAPDRSSREDYRAEREKHPLRRTIAQVINDLNPWDQERAKYIDMRIRFSRDPATFAKQVRVEQEKARRYIEYLEAAEKALRGMKDERDLEISPRWRAHYDLMLAQLLAYRVRMYEYGVYLEAFITAPNIPDPPTPTRALHDWYIATRKTTITGEQTAAAIKEATQRFQDVVEQHPDTPWASRAADELKRGFGVELKAHYENPNPPPRPVPLTPIVRPEA